MLTTMICAAILSYDPTTVGFDRPSWELDGSRLVIHDSAIASFDGRGGGVNLHRGQPLMDLDHCVVPFFPGGDMSWNLDPGTYEIHVMTLELRSQLDQRQLVIWTIVVPPPSRLERISGLVAQIIRARSELRSLGVSSDEVWDAMERVEELD